MYFYVHGKFHTFVWFKMVQLKKTSKESFWGIMLKDIFNAKREVIFSGSWGAQALLQLTVLSFILWISTFLFSACHQS